MSFWSIGDILGFASVGFFAFGGIVLPNSMMSNTSEPNSGV